MSATRMNHKVPSLSGTQAGKHRTRRFRWRLVPTDGASWLGVVITSGPTTMDGFDRTIVALVIALVVCTPLAIGSVHPWAFIAAEVTIFAIAVLAMAKLALRLPIAPPALMRLGGVVLPLGLFVGFCAFQLIALPPAFLRLATPSTYEFYVKNLSGWPQTAPYQAMFAAANAASPQAGASVPGNVAKDSRNAASAVLGQAKTGPAAATATPPIWRPVSIAPALARERVLKLTAYAALFLVVSLYPFGSSRQRQAEKRFFRCALVAIVFSGLLATGVDLLERLFWNGKILGVFVP